MKYQKWIFFALAAIVALLSQFYIQQRYTTLLQGGAEYQWPVKVNRHIGWVPSDYLIFRSLCELGGQTNSRSRTRSLCHCDAEANRRITSGVCYG